ncbi:disease resistance protein Roq1-like [Lycium barbarum]|uniref:disease resistance protein Roq1-like n=1 Tax=Lycium barbarum TaxID=112863 RepID=UPI00293EFE49|nr:disease resistance protein Roq1-like [Lycium barbarum]
MSHASPSRVCKYDVFLSFRGEDTSRIFVSHLDTALQDRGINTFNNDIEKARLAVVIFSKNYASSRWCLEELPHIIKCKNELDQIVIPVFYDVSPSDVCHQNGHFAESFSQHEKNYKDDLEKVQRWRDAFAEAGKISGFDLQNFKDEATCIKLIVNTIIHGVAFTKHLVGIKSRVKELTSLLNVELGGVYFVGIWGMSGSGKTTVARAIFDEIADQFEGSCFFGNVREISKKDGVEAPEHLQKKLLSQILKQQSPNIASANEGAKMISSTLCFKKVLIVLDDVDNDNQLEYLVGKRDWFGDGSRIITTSRNIDLLQNHNELYHVPELAFDEALELFSWHAFQQKTPDPEFENLSICLVIYANGLPLALEVLGSFLYQRGMNEWRSALNRLKDIGEGGGGGGDY